MKDLRLFSLMGGALILACLLAPKPAPAAPRGDARKDRLADRQGVALDVGPCHVDESFLSQRYVH